MPDMSYGAKHYHIVNVHLPKDRISMAHQGYGFCEFLTEEDAEYACKIMNQIKLWGKPIRVNKVRNRSATPRMCTYVASLHIITVLSFALDYCLLVSFPIGIIRQKAARRWCKPVHWQFGRERGRAIAI
jgi:RNA recognition motif-containing protein